MLTNCLAVCTIYLQQFPSYSKRNCKKNRHFHAPQPTFLFPLETPLRLSRNMLHGWKDNSMFAKPLAACTYLSSIVWVKRYLNQCVSPKIAIFTTFLFPLGDASGAIALNVVWMEREFDAYKLSRCMCPSDYYRFWDTARYLWKKSSFYHTPLHSTPPLGGFPSEYRHPLRDGKTRMVSLPDGENISKICLFILTWSTNVTDGRTDRQTANTALASHRAVIKLSDYYCTSVSGSVNIWLVIINNILIFPEIIKSVLLKQFTVSAEIT